MNRTFSLRWLLSLTVNPSCTERLAPRSASFDFAFTNIKLGGGDKDRTCYILLAKQALSQMSYTPK